MSKEELNETVASVTGFTPTYGEILAMNVLMRRAIDEAEEHAEPGLADLGRDFLSHFDSVQVSLAQQVYFEREYLPD